MSKVDNKATSNKKKRALEKKIQEQFSDYVQVDGMPLDQTSADYEQFKKDNMPAHHGTYDKVCTFFGQLPGFDPGKKITNEITESFITCHMGTKPAAAVSLALYGSVFMAIVLAMLAMIITQDVMMAMLGMLAGIILFFPLLKYPKYLAERWKMKSGNQMVLAVFYVVTYMRHTSNLERAIEFASDHIGPPLALDFRKILWDVETGKYESITLSLEKYLNNWTETNPEFIESMHLVQSSLLEDQESRRTTVLDKSLDVILNGSYEKMLHYAHNLQSPLTTLHMLGIIMPILGLVLLPLVVSFIPEIRWYHISLLYNIIIPVAVYYLGQKILIKRPSGYGGGGIDENNAELQRRKKAGIKILGITLHISPLLVALSVGLAFLIIGFFPLWMYAIDGAFDFGFGRELPTDTLSCGYQFCLLDYRQSQAPGAQPGDIAGPFGIGASILSLLIPLGLGVGGALYYSLQSMNVIEIRRETEQLEAEFGSALFQLGNRLDDGVPAEAAVGMISSTLPNSVSGNFFTHVYSNVQRLGISLEESIFNNQIGALVFYPSNLIESSMKVLIQSARKGPRVAAQALTNISRYLKEMHLVNERLQDLMAEVLSSMRSQINFLTPVIAGIVIGITSMITNILSQLSSTVGSIGSETGGGALGVGLNIGDIFGQGLPTFYFQVIVGLYVVQIVYILSILINGIKNGVDPLEERYLLGQNLLKSTAFYVLVAGLTMVSFNYIAANIVQASLFG